MLPEPRHALAPRIRLARPGDAQDIARMSRDLIEAGLSWGWRPPRVLRAIGDAQTNVAVAEEGGVLLGFGIMEYKDSDAYLALFAVEATRQRRGIGSALLRWLEDCARAAGAQCIRLEARRDNAAGRNFYNEHGYHELRIHADRYGAGVDGLHLEKWLAADDAAAAGLSPP